MRNQDKKRRALKKQLRLFKIAAIKKTLTDILPDVVIEDLLLHEIIAITSFKSDCLNVTYISEQEEFRFEIKIKKLDPRRSAFFEERWESNGISVWRYVQNEKMDHKMFYTDKLNLSRKLLSKELRRLSDESLQLANFVDSGDEQAFDLNQLSLLVSKLHCIHVEMSKAHTLVCLIKKKDI